MKKTIRDEIRDLSLWALLVLLALCSLTSLFALSGVLMLMGCGVYGMGIGLFFSWLSWRGVKLVLGQLAS
jgi:hypothetical protein